MEQTKYWMWPRRKTSGTDSWEELAFAEDSASALGSCIWPPRSYSCSFCRREFRSAQALGGHMNVHRRDRARLKQQSSSFKQYPSQLCTLVSSPNPNSNVADEMVCQIHKKFEKPNMGLSSSDSGGDEEEAISSKRQKKGLTSPFFIPFFIKPNFGERHHLLQSEPNFGERHHLLQSEPNFGERHHLLQSEPNFGERHHLLQSEVLGVGSNTMEDLDLELRLGVRPKIE